MALYDFGLTFEEFGGMTMPLLRGMRKRLFAEFRRNCILEGIGTSAYVNSQVKDGNYTAFDFAPAEDPADRERELVRKEIFAAIMPLTDPEAAKARRIKLLESFKSRGIDYAEQVFAEMFPTWKP